MADIHSCHPYPDTRVYVSFADERALATVPGQRPLCGNCGHRHTIHARCSTHAVNCRDRSCLADPAPSVAYENTERINTAAVRANFRDHTEAAFVGALCCEIDRAREEATHLRQVIADREASVRDAHQVRDAAFADMERMREVAEEAQAFIAAWDGDVDAAPHALRAALWRWREAKAASRG